MAETNKAKNTMPEEYDAAPAGVEEATQEEILMNENQILQGLIEAGTEKDSEDSYEKIQIRRNGILKFEFRIRPVSEKESMKCRERATKYAPRKRGQPRTEIETDQSLMRSWLIYTATVDEDRKKTWDNQKAKDAFNIIQGVEMIDAVLLSGEKDLIIDRINDISGYGEDMEVSAKN